jgi:hypothetical protein
MRSRIALAFCAALLAACASREVPYSTAAAGPEAVVAPSLVVEQFMRAVNENDLPAMSRLFGTRDGPVSRLDPRRQTEERMFAIASLLRHHDFAIEGQQIVPGRSEEAIQLMVRVTTAQRTASVPFTLVVTRDRNWLIEQIALDRLTHAR